MKKKYFFEFLTMILFIFGIVFIAYADSDSMTAQTTGTNYDPTVDTCLVNASTFNPTDGSTTTVKVSMNVTDINGRDDLNNSLVKVEFDNNVTNFVALYETATNATSCSSSNVNTTTKEYTCTVPMQYWFQHTINYSMRCSAGDNNDSTLVTKDTTNAFDYAKLVASTVDGTTVDFGTITSSEFSTNLNDTNTPVIINNTGNANLTTISITGANLTATGKTDINVSQFYADDIVFFNSSVAHQLNTTKQQISSVTVSIEDSTDGGTTDNVSFFFSVPSTLESGSYTGTWTLFEEE